MKTQWKKGRKSSNLVATSTVSRGVRHANIDAIRFRHVILDKSAQSNGAEEKLPPAFLPGCLPTWVHQESLGLKIQCFSDILKFCYCIACIGTQYSIVWTISDIFLLRVHANLQIFLYTRTRACAYMYFLTSLSRRHVRWQLWHSHRLATTISGLATSVTSPYLICACESQCVCCDLLALLKTPSHSQCNVSVSVSATVSETFVNPRL